jgi:hypothetical protein
MEDKGITPDEVTMTTAIKRMGSFEAALALIDDCLAKRWFVGRSSLQAAYSLPIGHLTAEALLEAYRARPYRFDTALEGPINQHRRLRRISKALRLVLVAPHAGTAQRLYRQAYGGCQAFFAAELEHGNDEDSTTPMALRRH